jgi:DNA repair protein RecN (Recombination protein N)
MLNKIFIKNYALIRELELSFDGGLTIITGETGAGKSIILGALGLILGNRADSSALLDSEEKCIVEGHFTIDESRNYSFFIENDIDFSVNTVMRREIAVNGRSRAFINDTPVNLDQMKELGTRFIDIHSQHQTLMLGDNRFQLGVLDAFAGHNGMLTEYSREFLRFREIKREYDALKERAGQNQSDLDYFTFQLKQLDDAKLVAGEEESLKSDQEILSHSSEIYEALAGSAQLISGEEGSVLRQLVEVKRKMDRIKGFYPDTEELLIRLESVIIEINDLGNELEIKAGNIEADPDRLEKVTNRLDLIFSLLQKNRVEDVASLISIRDQSRKKVDDLSSGDEKLDKLQKELDEIIGHLSKVASSISANRTAVVSDVEDEMTNLLKRLGMPNGRFQVKLTTLDTFAPRGKDSAEFLFSANRQSPPESLAKVASGGELSRVMLSLKSLLSDNSNLPTIFFDEIDAGVSGEIANMVGEILAGMGKKMQVINITHLPQVAALGNRHYHVYKEDDGNSTITHIKLLSKEERLNEVARLLSGAEITKASIENAKELLGAGN